jgi:hypothetical protein
MSWQIFPWIPTSSCAKTKFIYTHGGFTLDLSIFVVSLGLSYCAEFLYDSTSCNFWTEFEFIGWSSNEEITIGALSSLVEEIIQSLRIVYRELVQ